MTAPVTSSPAPARSARSFWVRQITLWHWVSSGVCLGGMLLFTVTGITLNHAASISAEPKVTQWSVPVPEPVRRLVDNGPKEGKAPLPAALAEWIGSEFRTTPPGEPAEWSEAEIYVSLPRPGGDGWVAIDRAKGSAKYEKTDRGWVSYLNDLHKGRHTGAAWTVFIDVVAAACLVFTITGLLILQIHAAKRPSTWPIVLLGLVIPLFLMLLFVHR